MPFRNSPRIFCLLLCANTLAMHVISHPIRSLFAKTLAYSLLLQIAYIGSLFLLVCLAVFAQMFKGLNILVFSTARNSLRRYTKPKRSVRPGASRMGQG